VSASEEAVPKPYVDQAMRTRTRTALLLAPIGIAAILLLPPIGFALLIGGLFTIGLWEWSRLCGYESIGARVALVAPQTALMAWLVFDGGDAQKLAMIVGVVFWFIAPVWLKFYDFARLPKRRYQALKAVSGALAVVPAFAALVLLRDSGAHGERWVMFLILMIWVADSGAYFSGKRFGREKLAPQISPGKTREGVYGALAATVLYAVGTVLVMKFSGDIGPAFVGLALLTVLFSIVGDLFESLIKRHSQVKDSGDLFPGHGGVFDRFDSLFAAAPIFVFGKALLLP